MSDRALRRPHGFTGLDYEHFSVNTLYDYYWLTGDPLARDELARAGRGLLELLEEVPFPTCRGEGWCMQAAVLIARGTGEPDVVDAVARRFRDRIEPVIGAPSALYVLSQPPHEQALEGEEAFDCPWQMSAFVHGAHAMYRQTGDPRFAQAGLQAARVMAGPGWVEDVGPKYLLSVDKPDRYMMPAGFGPLEGTAVMEIGGFVLADELSPNQVERSLFRRRVDFLLAPYTVEPERSRAAINPWFQILLDRRDRVR
jgi:hypothetical protein